MLAFLAFQLLSPPAQAAEDPLRGIAPPTGWQEIRIQIVPRFAATLAAPMSGVLAEYPLRDGDAVAAEQVLARFDCAEQEGAEARARAVLAEKRAVLATNARLQKLGTGAALDYQVAAAQEAEAVAELQVAHAAVAHCTVRAPFAGRVAGLASRQHQFVGLGAALIDVLDDRTLDVELIVPSRWLAWLRMGTGFDIQVDETGATYHAVLDRQSGRVDPVSQSIKLYATLGGAHAGLLPGMSGRALLAPPAAGQ